MDNLNTDITKVNKQITLMDAVKYPEVMALHPKQQHILVFLINGYSKIDTARFLHLNKNTITHLTLHDEKFKLAYAKLVEHKMDKTLDNASRVREGFDSDSIAAREKLAQLMKNSAKIKVEGVETFVDEAGDVPYATQLRSAVGF